MLEKKAKKLIKKHMKTKIVLDMLSNSIECLLNKKRDIFIDRLFFIISLIIFVISIISYNVAVISVCFLLLLWSLYINLKNDSTILKMIKDDNISVKKTLEEKYQKELKQIENELVLDENMIKTCILLKKNKKIDEYYNKNILPLFVDKINKSENVKKPMGKTLNEINAKKHLTEKNVIEIHDL